MSAAYDWLKMAEADKVLNRAQRLIREAGAEQANRLMEEAMGPRRDPLQPIFRDHNCGGCASGEKPCREGDYNSCSQPRARND